MAKTFSVLQRAAALLAALCLLAGLALPVCAEGTDNAPFVQSVETIQRADDPAAEPLTDEQPTEDKAAPDGTATDPSDGADADNTDAAADNTATADSTDAADADNADAGDIAADPTPTLTPAADAAAPAQDADSTATATPTPEQTPTATPVAGLDDEENGADDAIADEETWDTNSEIAVQSGTVFTCYFEIPGEWTSNQFWNGNQEVRLNMCLGGNNWQQVTMKQIVAKADNQQPVYMAQAVSVSVTTLPEVQFQFWNKNKTDQDGWVCQIVLNNLNAAETMNGKIYRNGQWETYNYHAAYAGQNILFENKSENDLANVTVTFYEKNGNTYTVVESKNLGTVAAGKRTSVTIPDKTCTYVGFTYADGTIIGKQYYNFYGETTDDTDVGVFTYSADTNCFIYDGTTATWGLAGAIRVYFDASLSKASYTNEIRNDNELFRANNNDALVEYGMPDENGKLWCYITKNDASDNPLKSQPMQPESADSDIWYIDVPAGYTRIRFAAWAVGDETAAQRGDGTAMWTIPMDLSEPCFFADTGDNVTYEGGNRGGYWGEKGSRRDAETGKKDNLDVVQINTGTFEQKANTTYVQSTLYDYYTDYELNGWNRSTMTKGFVENQRNWVTFRKFDEALSDYYKAADNEGKTVKYPLYTGHFQTGDHYKTKDQLTGKDVDGNKYPYHDVGDNNGLYGFNGVNNSNAFFAANNSVMDANGWTRTNDDNTNGKELYAFTFLGLVNQNLQKGTNDLLMTPASGDATILEPHFSKAFLYGENSMHTKLGEVYDDVQFPFTKGDVFGDGVDYWYFDSAETTVYLRQDESTNEYYLQPVGTNNTRTDDPQKNDSERVNSMNSNSGGNTWGVTNMFGFFPFNENVTQTVTARTGDNVDDSNGTTYGGLQPNRYNYGFGAKLEIPFSLTSNGKVVSTKKDDQGKFEEVPIRFYFSGDDDVWVYIDGQLALDIGGAHGKVSGVLDFSRAADGTITAYISDVKANTENDQNTSYAQETKTTLTFRNQPTNYHYKQTINISNLTTGKHTLTMFYMERGMWESNMAVAYNFPDSNELQVEKEVDVKNVDADFQKFFTDSSLKLFSVDVKTQATHYGTVKVNTDGTYEDKPVTNFTAVRYKAGGNTKDNLMDYSVPDGQSNSESAKIAHWYAIADDTQSQYRLSRYGQITLNTPLDISGMTNLSFEVYTPNEYCIDRKTPAAPLSMAALYLQLVDENGNIWGCDTAEPSDTPTTGYLSGKTDGNVATKDGTWCTIKVSLDKLEGPRLTNVKSIRLGYDFQRNIYFRNFTFSANVAPKVKTGFVTKQYEIPDYGSVEAKGLTIPKGAQYTSSLGGSYMIGANGQFDLADGEIVTFNDQFRRGSYISLAEDTNDKLFSTKWEIYENGRLVTNPERDDNAIAGGNAIPDPMQGSGTQPDDGRIEKYLTDTTDDHNMANTGYTEAQKPEGTNTIVFRSYSDPDGEEMFTKLKVKFINTVKVGTLSITKAQPAGEDALNGCKFTFTIKFTNIGGIGLGGSEGVTKRVTVPVGETVTIHGIPVGTNFTITETQQENSYLQGVTLNGETVSGEVRGAITAEGQTVKAVFTNTGRKLVDLTLNKQWLDANNAPLTGGLPDEIWVQLQRRYAGSSDEWQNVNAPVRLTPDTYTNAWGCVFRSLDAYDANNENKYYEYRVVESATKDGGYTASGTLKLGDYKYKVDSKTKTIAETDELASLILTNTQVPPVYELAITKQGLDENGTFKELLNGVEFKLEGLDDTTFKAVTKQTADDGKCSFTDLPAGRYRLTELKTVDGYNLLAEPIEFVLQNGECWINGTKQEIVEGDNANGFTVSLTINNRKGFTLPHTGADAPSLWLLIGLPLLVAGLLVLVFRYNRKGGKRS